MDVVWRLCSVLEPHFFLFIQIYSRLMQCVLRQHSNTYLQEATATAVRLAVVLHAPLAPSAIFLELPNAQNAVLVPIAHLVAVRALHVNQVNSLPLQPCLAQIALLVISTISL